MNLTDEQYFRVKVYRTMQCDTPSDFFETLYLLLRDGAPHAIQESPTK